ncbi:MAG: chromate transporter [Saccharofermentanales bacterium]|jgi:chromate transporter|nr:chromate transporter [Bacillota bacterium]
MIYLELFWVFFKIGIFAFGGGYAALPLIENYVVNQYSWLTIREMTDLVSLSQMTPGPIAINAATFVGTKVGGISGAIIATIGNVTFPFILMMTMGYLMFGGKKIKFLDKILTALKPAIVGLIAVASISMLSSSIFPDDSYTLQNVNWLGLIGFVLGISFYSKKKLSVIQLILLGAVIGVLIHAVSIFM